MLLNEVVEEVQMTKRAVKYYEEQVPLGVKKDRNGYRNYTEQNVETLKKFLYIVSSEFESKILSVF